MPASSRRRDARCCVCGKLYATCQLSERRAHALLSPGQPSCRASTAVTTLLRSCDLLTATVTGLATTLLAAVTARRLSGYLGMRARLDLYLEGDSVCPFILRVLKTHANGKPCCHALSASYQMRRVVLDLSLIYILPLLLLFTTTRTVTITTVAASNAAFAVVLLLLPILTLTMRSS